MISDYVKGKTKFDYPPSIQHGIMLHRMIDTFTDSHEANREAKEVFRPYYRLYSGAFVDVVYDHFLATDTQEFSEESLLAFSLGVYDDLDKQLDWQPAKFAHMYPYMKEHNWLYSYRTHHGTHKSLSGVVRRAAYLTESEMAVEQFEKQYQLLKDCYRHFWASVKAYTRQQFDDIQNQRITFH